MMEAATRHLRVGEVRATLRFKKLDWNQHGLADEPFSATFCSVSSARRSTRGAPADARRGVGHTPGGERRGGEGGLVSRSKEWWSSGGAHARGVSLR